MPRRPNSMEVKIDGRAARPAAVRRLASQARKDRGRLTREINGTKGRPRSVRRREALEQQALDAAERELRKVGSALRKQQRIEQRALRDEHIAARRLHQHMQNVFLVGRGEKIRDALRISVTVHSRPAAPQGWKMVGSSPSHAARRSHWKVAEDGLRTVHLSVTAATSGSRSSKRKDSGKKSRSWRRGDGLDNALYISRTDENGIGGNDLITNMVTGKLQTVASVEDMECVLACIDAAEQIEAEAADPRRRYKMFSKLIMSLPAELDASAHLQIMRRVADYFSRQGVPILLARHTPDDPENPNIHLHAHVGARRFAVAGQDSWAFAAECADDVLCRASLTELRQLLAMAMNEQLSMAGFTANFTHLSRLARGLAPSNERHRGPAKAHAKYDGRSTGQPDQSASETIARPAVQSQPIGVGTKALPSLDNMATPDISRSHDHAEAKDAVVVPKRSASRYSPSQIPMPVKMYTPGLGRPSVAAPAAAPELSRTLEAQAGQTQSEVTPIIPEAQMPAPETKTPLPNSTTVPDVHNGPEAPSTDWTTKLSSAGRQIIGRVRELSPVHWAAEALEKKRLEKERQEQAALAQKAEIAEAQRQSERAEAQRLYWESELFNMLRRNPRLDLTQPNQIHDGTRFSDPEDRRWVEQIYERCDQMEILEFERAYRNTLLTARSYVRRVMAKYPDGENHREVASHPARPNERNRQLPELPSGRPPKRGGSGKGD